MSITVFICILIIGLTVISATVYLWLRFRHVSELRTMVFNLVFDERPDFKERLKIYNRVGFNRMFFSCKPVKMNSFFTKQEIILLTHL